MAKRADDTDDVAWEALQKLAALLPTANVDKMLKLPGLRGHLLKISERIGLERPDQYETRELYVRVAAILSGKTTIGIERQDVNPKHDAVDERGHAVRESSKRRTVVQREVEVDQDLARARETMLRKLEEHKRAKSSGRKHGPEPESVIPGGPSLAAATHKKSPARHAPQPRVPQPRAPPAQGHKHGRSGPSEEAPERPRQSQSISAETAVVFDKPFQMLPPPPQPAAVPIVFDRPFQMLPPPPQPAAVPIVFEKPFPMLPLPTQPVMAAPAPFDRPFQMLPSPPPPAMAAASPPVLDQPPAVAPPQFQLAPLLTKYGGVLNALDYATVKFLLDSIHNRLPEELRQNERVIADLKSQLSKLEVVRSMGLKIENVDVDAVHAMTLKVLVQRERYRAFAAQAQHPVLVSLLQRVSRHPTQLQCLEALYQYYVTNLDRLNLELRLSQYGHKMTADQKRDVHAKLQQHASALAELRARSERLACGPFWT